MYALQMYTFIMFVKQTAETIELQRTSEVAEMCATPFQLWIGSSIVLDGRTARMCESRTTSDWCQRNIDFAVVDYRSRRHCRCRPVAGGRTPWWASALKDAARTTRQ